MKVLTINKFKIAPIMLKNVEMCQQFGSKNLELIKYLFFKCLVKASNSYQQKNMFCSFLKKRNLFIFILQICYVRASILLWTQIKYFWHRRKIFINDLKYLIVFLECCKKKVLKSANSRRKFYLFINFVNLFSHGLLDFYDILKKYGSRKGSEFLPN